MGEAADAGRGGADRVRRGLFTAATTSWKPVHGIDRWATSARRPVATKLTGAKASGNLYGRRITVSLVASLS